MVVAISVAVSLLADVWLAAAAAARSGFLSVFAWLSGASGRSGFLSVFAWLAAAAGRSGFLSVFAWLAAAVAVVAVARFLSVFVSFFSSSFLGFLDIFRTAHLKLPLSAIVH